MSADETSLAGDLSEAGAAQQRATLLARVEQATAARRAAEEAYCHAIVQARAQGVPVAAIARAAETTRPTIYRIADMSAPHHGSWPSILEAAAREVASITGDHEAAEGVAKTPTAEMKATRYGFMLKHPRLRGADLRGVEAVDLAALVVAELNKS